MKKKENINLFHDTKFHSPYSIKADDDYKVMELLFNLPGPNKMVCTITVENVQQHQVNDNALRTRQDEQNQNLSYQTNQRQALDLSYR